jgi:acyl carrier protein
LVGDLGAESIDFLDIVFRLEKAFDIKIPRGELFPEDILTNATYVADGRVTEAGLTELKKRMPFANLDEFAKNPNVQDFANLLTVADMCRFVETKVGVTSAGPKALVRCPVCGVGELTFKGPAEGDLAMFRCPACETKTGGESHIALSKTNGQWA